ncbi:MAG TPA: YicC/YloC family endoribonuclease, partial [Deferrisomatales bacterium]|nr:YicC/YloC family endoribonuclease [Deferrisomatales bacterium]
GRAEGEIDGRTLSVEVKAVNHRFLNFFAKLPGDLQRFEPDILGVVKQHLQRGQVNVFANWNQGADGAGRVHINVEAARQAGPLLRQAAEAAGIVGEPTLAHLLAVPAVITPASSALSAEELWARCTPLFETALRDLDGLRMREGEHLAADLHGRLGAIGAAVDQVEAIRPGIVEEYRARLHRRVEELARDLPSDLVQDRVAVEVAVFADRSDVSEEVVRLRSHLEKVDELLTTGGVVGRKLDFLLQELNREANTIGSKASNAGLTGVVVEIKSELEKIREQIQNIE